MAARRGRPPGQARADPRARCSPRSATGRARSSGWRSAPAATGRLAAMHPRRRRARRSRYERVHRAGRRRDLVALRLPQRPDALPAGAPSTSATPTFDARRRATSAASSRSRSAMDELAVRARASTRSSCACATTPSATADEPAVVQQGRCAACYRRAAPSASAGPSATRSRARCATAASWSATAWRRATYPARRRAGECARLHRRRRHRVLRSAHPATSAPAPTPHDPDRRRRAGPAGRTSVRFELGDTDLPQAPVHGGSMTVASVGPAVQAACDAARRQSWSSPAATATRRSTALPRTRCVRRRPDLRRSDPAAGESYAEILTRHGRSRSRRRATPGRPEDKQFSMHAFGALFAEVAGRSRPRHRPRHAPGRRLRRRPGDQPQDRAQPVHRRHGRRHRHGAARGDPGRSALRPRGQRQPRRVPRAGERRRRRSSRRSSSTRTTRTSTRSGPRAGRDRDLRRGARDRQRGLPCDRQALRELPIRPEKLL